MCIRDRFISHTVQMKPLSLRNIKPC